MLPIHVGSSGRVLLSQHGKRELDRILENIELTPVAANTITDKRILIEEIEKIRRDGYGVSTGEMLPDSSGISVPVTGYVCPVALCLFGPKFRFEPLNHLETLRQSAVRISEKLRTSMQKTDEKELKRRAFE